MLMDIIWVETLFGLSIKHYTRLTAGQNAVLTGQISCQLGIGPPKCLFNLFNIMLAWQWTKQHNVTVDRDRDRCLRC